MRVGRCVCAGAALLAGGPDGRHEVPEEPLPLRVPARLPRPAAQAPHPTGHGRRASQHQPPLVPPRPGSPAALRRPCAALDSGNPQLTTISSPCAQHQLGNAIVVHQNFVAEFLSSC